MRSDCIEGEMHQKLFGAAADPLGSSVPPLPRPKLHLWEGKAMGKGGRAGRIKGEMRGWGEDRRKRREGRNERKERGVVPHPKLNPGCATGDRQPGVLI